MFWTDSSVQGLDFIFVQFHFGKEYQAHFAKISTTAKTQAKYSHKIFKRNLEVDCHSIVVIIKYNGCFLFEKLIIDKYN